MSVIYATATKTARMTADIAQIDAGGAAGKIEIGTVGMAATLVTIPLGYSGASTGTVAGAVLTLAGFPRNALAGIAGKALAARVRTSANVDVITGLTVGLNSTVAPAWVASTAVVASVFRTNGANIYRCATAGTTAASGGPTGMGTAIADGTAVWDWYCVAGADILMDVLEFTSGMTVTINAASITHAA